MFKFKKIVIVFILLFFGACSIKVGVKVPEEKVIKSIPVSDNPYSRMCRALDSLEIDANILLNSGTFMIPDLPAIKSVNIEVPENLNLHVFLNIYIKKTYSEAQNGVKKLISIKPGVECAHMSLDKPISVRGRGIGFDLKDLKYEKQILTSEMRIKLDLISFFISPAVGIPLDEINQDVVMKLVKEIRINHMEGQFTPGETLNIKDVIMCIQHESSVEIKDTIYRNGESVSGVCSLTLSLENIEWTGNGFYLLGDNRSILKLKDLHFSYEKGLFIIQGDNEPLELIFAGSLISEVGEVKINPQSKLFLKSFYAEYGRDAEPDVRATAGTQWQVTEGWVNFSQGKLLLQSAELVIAEADIIRNRSSNLLKVKNMSMDAQLSFRAREPENILQVINEEVEKNLKLPVLSFNATNVYLPDQNYRIENFDLEVEDWQKVSQANGSFFLKLLPGPLLAFEAVLRLSLDTQIDATVFVDELRVPLHFEYDGKAQLFSGMSGFEVTGSIKTNKSSLVYKGTIGDYISKVPKQFSSVKKTDFSVFILPSTLTLSATAYIAQKENEYYLVLSQLDFSGILHTEFNAEKVSLTHQEISFGSDAVYGISASVKLRTGKSLRFKDEVNIDGEVFTAPFFTLDTITLPLGRLL